MMQSKLISSKKGILSVYMIGFIPRILFLIVVMLAVVILVRSYVVVQVDTFDAESSILINRLVYQKGALSYYDEGIGRIYPGMIDISNYLAFNETSGEIINYGSSSRHAAARISLRNTETGRLFPEKYLNREWYERWSALAKAKYKGPGGAKEKVSAIYVLIRDKNANLEKGELTISVIIPNT